ncbi:MAG: DUF4384 domain-containing protein [Gemmataceae bacterium]|nr:DUF4384 domain-containing protein [Gemmataceae bacterium]
MPRTIFATLLGLIGVLPAFAQSDLPAKAEAILKKNCYECHGGKKTSARLNVLDRGSLLKQKAVVPGNVKKSELVVRITAKDDSIMPPVEKGKLSAVEVATLTEWVKAGAIDFREAAPIEEPQPKPANPQAPDDSLLKRPLGVNYVLRAILLDIRRVPTGDRPFMRYMSLTHLVGGGITRDELIQHRDALAKAINHLSMKPKLVKPFVVESTHTVFRIDLRELGWDKSLLRRTQGKFEKSEFNVYDLALLEYPYAIVPNSETFQALSREFLAPAKQSRPIAHVRADWFASVATQPPLYHDFLQLPLTVDELEKQLAVTSQANLKDGRALRGGVINSGVSRNNRVNERHPARFGAYWRSYDYKSSTGTDNIFLDPVNLSASGGEMIFNLPNGLQGYYICDQKGNRIDAAPTNIVVDTFASDKIVRNGLACMRCHDKGMKEFADIVRPVLKKLQTATFDRKLALLLYREQKVLDQYLNSDRQRFQNAMKDLLGKESVNEPLRLVSRRFLDERLTLSLASAELGLAEPRNLEAMLKRPEFTSVGLAPLATGQPLARDAWEANFDSVVARLNLGSPLVPLDGLLRPDHAPEPAPFDLEVKTNKKGNLFAVGDEIVVTVKPSRNVFVEIVTTNARGGKTIVVPSNTLVRAGQTFRFPSQGKTIRIPKNAGQEFITVLASTTPFPAGEVVSLANVSDRVIHSNRVVVNGSRIEVQVSPNPQTTVKRTLLIETR